MKEVKREAEKVRENLAILKDFKRGLITVKNYVYKAFSSEMFST